MATPLLVALVVIETSDLVFALDSIPAVFAVTRDPFLVYTSNVFALLGLRSLYFVLAGAIRELRFLRTGLAIMLLLVAAKMLRRRCGGDTALGIARRRSSVIFGVAILASRLFPGPARAVPESSAPACTHLDQIRDVRPEAQACARVRSARRRMGRICACAAPAATSAAATTPRTGMRRAISRRPDTRWRDRSRPAKTGPGATSTACESSERSATRVLSCPGRDCGATRRPSRP